MAVLASGRVGGQRDEEQFGHIADDDYRAAEFFRGSGALDAGFGKRGDDPGFTSPPRWPTAPLPRSRSNAGTERARAVEQPRQVR